jgi:hypothetical protein
MQGVCPAAVAFSRMPRLMGWVTARRRCPRMRSRLAGGPGSGQLGELGVQRNITVVAGLAGREPEPVVIADADDGVCVPVGQFAGG